MKLIIGLLIALFFMTSCATFWELSNPTHKEKITIKHKHIYKYQDDKHKYKKEKRRHR